MGISEVAIWLVGGVLAASAVVLAVEVMARWHLRRSAYYVWNPGYRLHLSPSPEVFPQLERLVRFEINSCGERADEIPRRQEGVYRILVVGGSAVEGYFLDQASTWPAVMQETLSRPEHLATLGARAVHVGALARAGVSTAALDLMLAHVLPRYPRVSAIVIMIGGSDVFHWIEDGTPASMPVRSVEASDIFEAHPEIKFGWSVRRLGLAEVGRRLRWSRLHMIDKHEMAGRWIGRARKMRREASTVIRTVPDPTPMTDYAQENLKSIVERCRAVTERIIIARQPWFRRTRYTPEESEHFWEGGVGKAWREEITTYYSPEAISFTWDCLDKLFAQLAEDLGVEHVDVAAHLEPSLEHYYDFAHFTPAGARIVGETVAAGILRNAKSADRHPRETSGAPSLFSMSRTSLL